MCMIYTYLVHNDLAVDVRCTLEYSLTTASMKPIWELKYMLFANDPSVKTIEIAVVRFTREERGKETGRHLSRGGAENSSE